MEIEREVERKRRTTKMNSNRENSKNMGACCMRTTQAGVPSAKKIERCIFISCTSAICSNISGNYTLETSELTHAFRQLAAKVLVLHMFRFSAFV